MVCFSVEVLPDPGMYFSNDLGELLEQDVELTLAELFPPDPVEDFSVLDVKP
jgi:hypothetical protein